MEHQHNPTGTSDVADQPNNPIEQPQETPSEDATAQSPATPEAEAAATPEAAVTPETVGTPEAVAAETPAADEVPSAEDTSAEQPVETAEETAEEESVAEVKAAGDTAGAEQSADDEEEGGRDWYILKVQSNRENSIREGLLRRIKIAGLDDYFGDVIVPIEKVTEVKGGKKRVVKRKLYPGYLVVNMEINDDTWFLVRETPGIGDFTGAAGRPTPMLPHEVSRIVAKEEEKGEKQPKLEIGFRIGDRVKINDGNFENFEGEVESIDEANGRVTIIINIFGRSTPVELEYWQIATL